MTNNLLTALAIANLAAGAAILVVLALRKPARALLGARAAYGLWLIVPAAMLATFIPARTVVVVAPALVRAPLQPAIVHAMAPPAIPIHAAPILDLSQVLTALWLAGVAVSLILLAISQRRALARFGRITRDEDDPRLSRASSPTAGPALFGVFRPRLIVPADFETAFEADEQAMILAHERTHLASGHTLINGGIAGVRVLNWFNPLIHLAARYARIDQELACDAAVLARHPASRQTYARALVKTQLASAPLPLGCYWPGRSAVLLEERITMLAKSDLGRVRPLTGVGAVIALSLAAALAAWAAEPSQVKTMVVSEQSAIDPLANLGPDATAVVGAGKDASLLLTETDHGVKATRTLKIGDEYRAGWKIDAISAGSATLTRGDQSRVVILSGLPQVAMPVTVPSAPVVAAITNATAANGAKPTPPATLATALKALADFKNSDSKPTDADMSAHVAAINAVFASGGTAQDVATVEIGRQDFPPVSPLDPTTARLVQNENGAIRINMVEVSTGLERSLLIPGIQVPGGNANIPVLPNGSQPTR